LLAKFPNLYGDIEQNVYRRDYIDKVYHIARLKPDDNLHGIKKGIDMPKVKILIVEDDDVLARVISWRLGNLGYEVCGRTVTSAETMELLAIEKPDLVFMDINIKGDIDGIETAKLIKNEFKLPVVYLTSHCDGPTLERAKATRPDGFVLKPFADNDLRVAVELALKK
jgi:CheY-like chemotaxis protein